MKITFTSAIIAIIVGLIIVKLSLAAAPIIRDNIVSCLPEELSEMFDKEQSTICSRIQSLKTTLITGSLFGLGVVVIGLVLALVSIIPVIIDRRKDHRNLHL